MGSSSSLLPDRLARRIEKQPSGCWQWTGYVTPDGYGRIQSLGAAGHPPLATAHRLVWTALGRTLPENLHHLCGNRSCVNPIHLEPLSVWTHQRHHGDHRQKTRADRCAQGHSLADAYETRLVRSDGTLRIKLKCRACSSASCASYYRQKQHGE